MGWYEESFRVTVVLVAASAVLVCAGLAGLGASLALVGVFAVLAGGLFALRDRSSDWPTVVGHDLGRYGVLLWLGPAVAAVVCLLSLGATPDELQALGGLVGLAGMGNYFLRPVYRAGITAARMVTRVAD